MANPFSISRDERGDIIVITLDGYLDAHTAPQFETAIEESINDDRIHIVVDCQKLTYISSAGLGVFMSFIEEARERGGDIKVSGLQPKVAGVFEVLGFSEIFDITETIDEAVARFSSSQAAGAAGE